ncbi:nicotinate-nucleotide pyrophosphorylase [carboxylating]-like [Oppia nitens]|uniref:nicotinate-nucleotide pyrophosphorylase [carboxylating]-like n=1 Tax=Oppia nitens TaxID=1686743 RepID=UPI0023D997A6|nr:nicotinate-nucleotide pyrophosphorylase [carboxylating]-like [Oppia nitens]
MSYQNILNPIQLKELAKSWINEDLSSFDMQALVCDDKEVRAVILCKSDGVLAGVPFANAIFNELDCRVNWLTKEGDNISLNGQKSGSVQIAYVDGKARSVLLAERVVLNVLSRCSGVATQARQLRQSLQTIGWKGMIAGTRKTTPGFRTVEKYGLLIGGVSPHRYDLSTMVMLKDNHIVISGSVKAAISAVRSVGDFVPKIEVECRNPEEAEEAAQLGADIIMLDNFDDQLLLQTAQHIKSQHKDCLIEASGGINPDNVHKFANQWIDIISMSCLVQGYPTVDYSMKIQKSL